jgi:hypothetical protein
METNQASEHLQVIRTLMERSALYRRALAPIMTFCGTIGIVAGVVGWRLKINSDRDFILFWSGVALLALSGAYLFVRRQALKDSEPFWSPPTRRVTQALTPPLFVGFFINLAVVYADRANDKGDQFSFLVLWIWLYGCAIHSAGFFMVRGMRTFGWIFVIAGCVLFPAVFGYAPIKNVPPHFLMAGLFGGLQFAYGIYLYFTENRKTAP